MSPVIEVSELVKTFGRGKRWFSAAEHQVQAVRNVSFSLQQGETLAIVGESGSGKSTLARMLVGLEQPTSGTLKLMGQDANEWRRRGARAFGKTVQYVFQDPVASLNPRKTIAETLAVPLHHLCGYAPRQQREKMGQLMQAVNMPLDALTCYPHEFSGGQAQRLAIARALAAEANILVLDEPVSALDVSVQAQVLLLLDQLKQQFDLSYIFISHDLAVVESIASRVAVMYLGEWVECADSESLFSHPTHPYTQSLLASAPRLVSKTEL